MAIVGFVSISRGFVMPAIQGRVFLSGVLRCKAGGRLGSGCEKVEVAGPDGDADGGDSCCVCRLIVRGFGGGVVL